MAILASQPISSQSDLLEFEAEMALDARLPEQSILEVFENSAARDPEATALTMLMTGAEDEEPRRVTYQQLL